MNAHDDFPKRFEYFLFEVDLNLFERHLSGLLHEFLCKLLVDVPNVAALNLLQLCVQFIVEFLTHVVLGEEVADESVPDVIVCLELANEICIGRWQNGEYPAHC